MRIYICVYMPAYTWMRVSYKKNADCKHYKQVFDLDAMLIMYTLAASLARLSHLY